MNKRKGEISTLLLLGTLAIIGVATLVTSTLNQNRQTTQTRADETWQCPGGNCDKCGVDGWWGSGCTQFCEEHPGDAPGCAAPPGGGNEPTTAPGGGSGGDGPGGLCNANTDGADARGCGGGGCRSSEKCDIGGSYTCLWQNVPPNQTCGGSSAPSATPTLRPITPMVTVITPPPAGGGGTQPTTPPSGGGGSTQPTTRPVTTVPLPSLPPGQPSRTPTPTTQIARYCVDGKLCIGNTCASCRSGFRCVHGGGTADCTPVSDHPAQACPADMPNIATSIEAATLSCRSQNQVVDRSRRLSDNVSVCYSCKNRPPSPIPTSGTTAGHYCNGNQVCEYNQPISGPQSRCETCGSGTRCEGNTAEKTASCVQEGVRSQTVVAPETAVFEACEDINNPTDGCVVLPI